MIYFLNILKLNDKYSERENKTIASAYKGGLEAHYLVPQMFNALIPRIRTLFSI